MSADPVLIVGHYCHDTSRLKNGITAESLGGSASYISAVFESIQLEHRVIAKVGEDFKYFSQVAQRPKVIQDAKTTHFVADLSSLEREAKVQAVCESISSLDLQQIPTLRLALSVGIIGEVLPDAMAVMAMQSTTLLCDIQGLIRYLDPMGNVKLRYLHETPFYAELEKISYLKMSQSEAAWVDLDSLRQKTCILLTQGSAGCVVLNQKETFSIAGFPTEEVDSTGAGDCFLAGFTMGLGQGLPLPRAVRLGNYFGALAVQQVGVPRFSEIKLDLPFAIGSDIAPDIVADIAEDIE